MTTESLVLWQLSPCWGLPNPSPFCLKLETWLRMAGIEYVAKALPGPPKSRSKKVPYIERSDGSLLDDSNVIIEQLSDEHQVKLDSKLGAHERALATLALRTIEDSMYFAGLYSRWVDPRNWRQTRDAHE